MNKKILSLLFFISPLFTFAQEKGLDQQIDEVFGQATGWFVNFIFYQIPFTDDIQIYWVLFPLILGATYFTFYFKFISFRGFMTSINIVRGKYDDIDHHEALPGITEASPSGDIQDTIAVEGHDGEVSHFQALTAALSATVGLGNIAGVAIAVSIGGAGATFWMIVAGLLGMASKFVECTLGVKYRDIGPDGTVYGGPMYYLTKGLKSKGFEKLGKVLAALFAIFVIGGSFGGGNMFQVNQAFQLIENITGGTESVLHGKGWLFGVIMAIFVGIVIIGGIKKIASVTDKIVPFMVVIYVSASVFVLIAKYDMIGDAIMQIYNGAFSPIGVVGGAVGVLVQGFRRAAFSNEAGVGSASIAHSAVKTKEPITEGFVSLLEPFIDTVVICTMTALVITISGQLILDPATGNYVVEGGKIATIGGTSGVALTSAAFASAFSWFPFILAIAVILFAFSTMISWSYYGLKAWTYLFGEGKTSELVFKIIFCVFIVIGAAASLGPVIDFSDAAIFAMAVVNITGLYCLMSVVKSEFVSYKERLASGEIKKFEH